MKLSSSELSWLEAQFDAVIPPGGEVSPLSATDTGAAHMFDEMISILPASTAAGLRAAVLAIEFVGPFWGLRRAGRFTRLSLEDRERCMVELLSGRSFLAMQLATLIKMMACMSWGGDERVRSGLGLDRPPRFVNRENPDEAV